MSQHKGVQKRASAPKDSLNTTLDQGALSGASPSNEQLKISYACITAVHLERSTVDVRLFGSTERGDDDKLLFELPLLHPLTYYHQNFGQLAAGMCVRITWRGGLHKPGRDAIAEVIGNEAEKFRSGKKEYEACDINKGVWRMFAGGIF